MNYKYNIMTLRDVHRWFLFCTHKWVIEQAGISSTTPSPTTPTCNCLTPTSLQPIENSSPTTHGESSSPYTTTSTASPSPSSNSSTIPISCPTLMATGKK